MDPPKPFPPDVQEKLWEMKRVHLARVALEGQPRVFNHRTAYLVGFLLAERCRDPEHFIAVDIFSESGPTSSCRDLVALVGEGVFCTELLWTAGGDGYEAAVRELLAQLAAPHLAWVLELLPSWTRRAKKRPDAP